jgi:hypothetical protein
MRLTFQVLLLTGVVACSGCSWFRHEPAKYDDVASTSASAAGKKPIVKASDELVGRVVRFNTIGRFAVLNFPVNRMPAVGRTLFVYREGLKVGEIKVTGPVQDDNIVGDLVSGDGKAGDEVRDR